MKTIEYIAEVLPDGHLSIPEAIIKKLNLKAHTRLRILIFPAGDEKKGLIRFCGKWQDNREADDIVTDIYQARRKNIRSERAKL